MSSPKGCGASFSLIEARHPGFKVIAGPFSIAHASSNWREERRQCQEAYNLQRRAGVKAIVVSCNGRAYVLRSEVGWLVEGGEDSPSAEAIKSLVRIEGGRLA